MYKFALFTTVLPCFFSLETPIKNSLQIMYLYLYVIYVLSVAFLMISLTRIGISRFVFPPMKHLHRVPSAQSMEQIPTNVCLYFQ